MSVTHGLVTAQCCKRIEIDRERKRKIRFSENGDIVVDFGAVPLSDAFSNPHDVPALLFLQFNIGVEHTEVKLVQEGQFI